MRGQQGKQHTENANRKHLTPFHSLTSALAAREGSRLSFVPPCDEAAMAAAAAAPLDGSSSRMAMPPWVPSCDTTSLEPPLLLTALALPDWLQCWRTDAGGLPCIDCGPRCPQLPAGDTSAAAAVATAAAACAAAMPRMCCVCRCSMLAVAAAALSRWLRSSSLSLSTSCKLCSSRLQHADALSHECHEKGHGGTSTTPQHLPATRSLLSSITHTLNPPANQLDASAAAGP